MAAETTQVTLARLDERLRSVQQQNMDIKGKLDDTTSKLGQMENRLANVETSLTQSKPVIDEFITIKTKVVGAGQFGKWVWVIGASVISLIIGSKTKVVEFLLTGNIKP